MKKAEEYSHILYEKNNVVPVICERKDWKRCPEHKHLSEERPDVKKDKFVTEISFEPFIDDPNDDIISIAEYGATSVAEEYVPPVHEDFKPAVWEPHTDSKDTDYDKQGGIGGKVLKTLGAVAGAAGIALLLSSCSASTLNSGTVSDSSHHEAYTSYSMICSGVKVKTCTTVPIHHPEQWTITVQGNNAEGKPETRTLYVEEPVFDDYQIGEHYEMTDKQMQESENAALLGNIGLGAAGALVGAGVLAWGGISIKNKIEELRWNRES